MWIPPGPLRDLRELTRTRQVLVRQRTRLKNRIQATLCKYGRLLSGFGDAYGRKARVAMEGLLEQLPPQTACVTRALLEPLDFLEPQIAELEQRLGEIKTRYGRMRSERGIETRR